MRQGWRPKAQSRREPQRRVPHRKASRRRSVGRQWKDLMDAREQQRPGVASRATCECFRCLLLALLLAAGQRACGGDLRRDRVRFRLSCCHQRRGGTLRHASQRGDLCT